MRRLALLVLGMGLCIAAEVRSDDADKEDQKKFQGSWAVVQAEESGKANDDLKAFKITFKDDKVIVQFKDMSRSGTFKLDPTKDPKEIEIQPDDEKGKVLGIYKVEDKKITLCMGDTGKERPREFKTQVGQDAVLMVLEPAKP